MQNYWEASYFYSSAIFNGVEECGKYSGATNVRILLPGYTGWAINSILCVKLTPNEVNGVVSPGMQR